MMPTRRGAGLAAALLLGASCMNTGDVVTGRPWALVSIDGRPAAAEAALAFDDHGGFTVRPGCDSGGGEYQFEGNRVVTDMVGLTMMLCPDAAAMVQEAAVMGVLEAGPVFAVDSGSGRLRLEANGTVLLFDVH